MSGIDEDTSIATVLEPSIDRARKGLQDFSQRHRRGLIVAAMLGMTGFALTAVAVAPMVQEAPVAQRIVAESIVPEGLDSQLASLASQELTLTRSDITRSIDTPESLLARLGVQDAEAAQFIRKDSVGRALLAGRGGKMVQAHTDGDGRLHDLVARFPSDRPELALARFNRLVVERAGGRWQARVQTVAYGSQPRLASGTIRSTLFAATDEAGLPDEVAAQLSEIFSTDIDFHRELRRGDSFAVEYEALTADGEPVAWGDGAGRVLAAEFVTGGRAHHAVWFTGADGRGAYFDAMGRSKRRAFLASPLEFSRVTSGFAMRTHPLTQDSRKHNGVDYSAPTGTPVRAVSDGSVQFAGSQNGYGNMVEIRHPSGRSTLYAHLSRIDVKKGQHIDQGQRLGAVGMTGWATGPHLHFEFRVAGVHMDPLLIAKASETVPVDAASRPRFAEIVRSAQANLVVAESISGTRVRAE
jgi:murein DD-endopeptidase MepM/ murein hydrolase activator NlpD